MTDTALDARNDTTSDAHKIDIATRMIAAWKAMDWDAAAALFAENGVLHSMMVDPIEGREAIHKRISGLGELATEIVLDVSNMGVINGILYMERVDRFVYNGKTGAVPVTGVFEFDGDGLIKVWREYYDRGQLLSEMGVATDFDHETR
ncbi:nuclear transport factor 2 family protein [Sphingomonas sp. Leaf357]|uniref:nuclear transport factor 2 family protein n=1 Tax=Sphingomonas sp. Leaf357 TaxID=1736350 RepID=UPI0009EAF4FE|nr:nuclear transport factor 2 family protein [Sphingomonas sp. Leaf357]